MCLRDKEIKNLKDLQKALLETDKKLNLKCVEGIEAIIEELKEKVSREAKEEEYSKEAILKLSENIMSMLITKDIVCKSIKS